MARHSPPYPTLFPFPCQVAALDRVVTSDALKGVEFVLSAAKLDFFGIPKPIWRLCPSRTSSDFLPRHTPRTDGVLLFECLCDPHAEIFHPVPHRRHAGRVPSSSHRWFCTSAPEPTSSLPISHFGPVRFCEFAPAPPMSAVERASKMVDNMILILSHFPRPPRSTLHLGVTQLLQNFLCRFPPSHARVLKPLPAVITADWLSHIIPHRSALPGPSRSSIASPAPPCAPGSSK